MSENKELKEIDNFIFNTYKKLDIYQYLTPINFKEENQKFIKYFQNGIEYNPIYNYRKIEEEVDIDFILNTIEIYKFKINQNNDFISKKLLDALEELKNNINLCKNVGNSECIISFSNKIYGMPNQKLINKAINILEEENVTNEEEYYSSVECKEIFEHLIKEIGIDWQIMLNENQASKVSVIPEKKLISINSNIKFSKDDIKRLLVHEIGTHALRAENGSRQPYKIFSFCLEKNLFTEEGLATVNEELAGVLNKRTFRIYAGRVFAVAESLNKSFYEVFKGLVKYFNFEDALYIVARVKRGIKYTEQKGCFSKDFVYLKGYYEIKSFCNNFNKDDLYIGVISINEAEVYRELVEKRILERPFINLNKVLRFIDKIDL